MSKREYPEPVNVPEKRSKTVVNNDGDKQRLASGDYTVGWICAIQTEYVAARTFLDEKHGHPESISSNKNDNNVYTLGRLGEHNVVITVLPREYGIASAASVARDMLSSFPNIRIGLMVGIGGGAPSRKHDIRLGDIVVSTPDDGYGGVFQYDFGRTIQEQPFQSTGSLNRPPTLLLAATTDLAAEYEERGHQLDNAIDQVLEDLPRLHAKYKRPDRSTDRLYRSNITHPPDSDSECAVSCGDDPSKLITRPERTEDDSVIHYGLIASANQVMKDATIRDKLTSEKKILCFEMEAAGLMNHFPCLVIRGICDYCDTHKNWDWQGYAAMVSAAYANDLLRRIPQNRVAAQERISDIISSVQEVEQKVSRVQEQVKVGFESLQQDRERDTRQAILNWLTPMDFSSQQSDFIGRRQQGTGQWFLDSAEFRNWIETDKQTLFCPGIPGAGKTMLTSIVVEELIDRADKDEKIGIAYIYCMFQRQNEQKADDLLASVLKQLLLRDQFPLPDNVKSLYNKHKDGQLRPSFDEISSTLQSVIGLYSRVFIVIDALDECSDGCRAMILAETFKVQFETGANLFATSRSIPTIVNEFKDCPSILIHANESDVMKYIDGYIPKLQHCVQNNYNLQAMIKSKISKSVGGMFLLVQLYMDSLIDKTTPNKILDALETFPKGPSALSYAYGQVIKRIRSQNEGFRRLAEEVLLWLTCSKRLLTTVELRHALSVKPHTVELDENDLEDASVITSFCAGLVTVDKESNVVRLVHDTTREFLESHMFCLVGKTELGEDYTIFDHKKNDVAMIEAHRHITITCVTYLSFNTFESGVCEMDQLDERFQSNPLYSYVTRNWGHHACAASMKAEGFIIDFLENDGKVSASSQALMASNTYIGYDQRKPWVMTGMHLAAFFGLSNELAVDLLQRKQYDPNVQDTYGRTPLLWAAEKGHKNMVDLLLGQAGVDINCEDDVGRTPLSLAAENGHDEVVEALLARDNVDAHSWDVYDQTPLWWATENGHERVVKLLLERDDVDVNFKEMYSQKTPLSIAVDKGYDRMVKLLLSRQDVDADLEDGVGRTPLSIAADKGHEGIINLLLSRENVDAEQKRSISRTRLSIAAEKGYEGLVKLLLSRENVDADHRDDVGRTPLSWAAEKGHETIVSLLLARGDVNAYHKDKYGRAPLWWAGTNRHEEIIKLLLAKKGIDTYSTNDSYGHMSPLLWVMDAVKDSQLVLVAAEQGYKRLLELLFDIETIDPDPIDESGRTPLSLAAEKGQIEIVNLLINNGADIYSLDHFGQGPLLWAAKQGQKAIVKLLLDKGAELKSTNEEYDCEQLGVAADYGHKDIIKLLLERGTNIESNNWGGKTALSWAAWEGREDIVRLLLEKGANIEQKGGETGWTPLARAARRGHVNTVQLLIEKGADIESRDVDGDTPLSLAVWKGHKSVVKLLIENGADIESKVQCGDTPLSKAVWEGHKDIVKLLIENGANIESKDCDGDTPLSRAAWEGHKDIVKLLIEKGADIDSMDWDGETPLSLAREKYHTEIINLLMEHNSSE